MQLYNPRAQESGKTIEPEQLTAALESLGGILSSSKQDGLIPPLVTPPALRVGIRRIVEPSYPRLPVISLAELPPQTPLQTVSVWELPDAA
jgi:flagellar biosynthesis protein FlhA